MLVLGGTVDIDVMDLADDPLPREPERRAFALARRAALASAQAEHITVTDLTGQLVVASHIPAASVGALTALKTVSMIRRPHSKNPHKVGSDIHDLVRLVSATGARTVADELVNLDRELAGWVRRQIARAFGEDLQYTLLRFRRNDRSPAALALTDDDISATVVLADALTDRGSG